MMATENLPEKAVEDGDDDWGLALDFHLFAQHEKHKVYWNSHDFFWVECVEALTPLDMMNLSGGIHDATGNCVWTGAFLFLLAVGSSSSSSSADKTTDLFWKLLHEKRILELGSGTGIAGLGVLRTATTDESEPSSSHRNNQQDRIQASFCCLTDADPDALRLCRRNCDVNTVPRSSYSIKTHLWGTTEFGSNSESNEEEQDPMNFDTVMAADVLYDIGMLEGILQSAKTALTMGSSQEGHFILSHVPRACYNSHHPPPSSTHASHGDKHDPVQNLEDYIVNQARQCNFDLVQRIQPLDLNCTLPNKWPLDALNDATLEEMQDMGAAIFIFQLQTP